MRSGDQVRVTSSPGRLHNHQRGVLGRAPTANRPNYWLVFFRDLNCEWYYESELTRLSLLELLAEAAAGISPVGCP